MFVLLCSASNHEIQGLGRWAYDAFRMSYLTNLPHPALLVAARYSISPTSYVLLRSRVPPPPALIAVILPWVELELGKTRASNLTRSKETCDLSAVGFLETLVWLKCVFLQDMAVLQKVHPSLPIFTHDVFSLPEWGLFSEDVQKVETAAIAEVNVPMNSIYAFPPNFCSLQLLLWFH